MAEIGVVVTGMGAVSSLGYGVPAMWQGLVAGRCGIGALTRIDPTPHRIRHAGQVPEPLGINATADPVERFLMAACFEALEQAQAEGALRETVGLALGSNFGAMSTTERLLTRQLPAESGGNLDAVIDGVTCAVAEKLGLGGTRTTLSLSCASGNAALGCAADLIRSGRAQAVLAGGYDAISEVVWAGLSSLRAMSADALRPFDKRRDGTIFGEGAGVMLLESEAHALRRGVPPLAVLAGYATTSNAFHMTHPDEDGAGMARAMRAALRDAGMAPEELQHVNAHATGTQPNDRLETAAIKSVFGEHARRLAINGIKSMLGHAMGAASALEAIATVMAVREGVVPPTIGLEQPDPDCDLDYVPLHARQMPVRAALNNSAGFGGCNASVIFRRVQ